MERTVIFLIHEVFSNDLEIFCYLIFSLCRVVLESEIDMNPYFFSYVPQTIDNLSIPLHFRSLAKFVPKTIVIFAPSFETLIRVEHFSGDKFVLDIGR